jgi:hypothetical protein
MTSVSSNESSKSVESNSDPFAEFAKLCLFTQEQQQMQQQQSDILASQHLKGLLNVH